MQAHWRGHAMPFVQTDYFRAKRAYIIFWVAPDWRNLVLVRRFFLSRLCIWKARGPSGIFWISRRFDFR